MAFRQSTAFVAYRQATGSFAAAAPAGYVLEVRDGTQPAEDGAHNTGTLRGSLGGGLPAGPWSQSARTLSNAAQWLVSVVSGGMPTWFSIRASGDDGSGSGTANRRLSGTLGQLGTPKAITAGAINGANYEFTAAAHGYSVGDQVKIVGHGVAALNGLKRVATVPGANVFGVANPSGNASTAANGNAQSAPYDVNVTNATLQFGDTLTFDVGQIAVVE